MSPTRELAEQIEGQVRLLHQLLDQVAAGLDRISEQTVDLRSIAEQTHPSSGGEDK